MAVPVAAEREMGKRKSYSRAAGKKPAYIKALTIADPADSDKKRPISSAARSRNLLGLGPKKSMPVSTKNIDSMTPRTPLSGPQGGPKKSGAGDVFSRLTNRKSNNYESQLKKKFGVKHGESKTTFGNRKQSANIKPSSGPSMTFNQGKVNETIYSNRSHHAATESQVDASDYEESPYPNQLAGYSQEPQTMMQSWAVDLVVDQAHSQQIYDIATVGNLLYTTSLKSLKIWDINTM